jgi:hypothetical protein
VPLPVLSSIKHDEACAIAKLRLPLWFVYDRRAKSPPQHAPCDDTGSTLAFSVIENLTAFLHARKGGRWKLELASDLRELTGMLADLHERGDTSICLDPEPDGSGGELVTLAELLEFCESLPKD